MKLKPLLTVAVLLCGLTVSIPALLRAAQKDGGGTASASGEGRIAVADAARIFKEMQETKDVERDMGAERDRLEAVAQEKDSEVRKLQAQRDQLRVGAPQYEELNEKLNDAALELRLWVEQTNARNERSQKRQVRAMFAKIEAAVAEIAQRDGYELVLAKQRPELPENLDRVKYEQIVSRLAARNMLFASERADISDEVIALLDAQYKNQGGAGGAAPAAAREPAAAAGSPRRSAPRPAGGSGAAPGNANAGQK